MTHDDLARELYQKDKDNTTSVLTRPKGLYEYDYYCGYCKTIIDRYEANYCYNCGKKLDWNKRESIKRKGI